MKRAEVAVGHIYLAKISGRFCRVRIDRPHAFYSGSIGWDATNLETERSVSIRTAAKLRSEVHKCASCGALQGTGKGVTLGPDEYAEEILGDNTPVWKCQDCRRESARDI
jgi:hypothetical protein